MSAGATLGRGLLAVLKVICYLSLVIVAGGFLAMIGLSLSGACPTLTTGQISCTSDIYKSLATFGMSVVLVTVFTGLPGLLAMAGIGFLIHSMVTRGDRKKAQARRAQAAPVPAHAPVAPHQPSPPPLEGEAAPPPVPQGGGRPPPLPEAAATQRRRPMPQALKIALIVLAAIVVLGAVFAIIGIVAGPQR